jgi:hypothetical protein
MSGTLVFPRGSHVLEYWLAHAEGFTVRSRGPVEHVIVEPLYGRATALVVRSGRLRRRQVVSAAEVVAVDPEACVLELEEPAALPKQPSRAAARARDARAFIAPRLRALSREAWAIALTLAAAVVERGARAERGAAAARARRPRGAVGRHVRP